MTCYHPIKAFRTASGVSFSELSRDDHLGDIELPCGRCVGCRLRRANEWALRVMHEAKLHQANCFVTLTYRDEDLPENGSLRHRDFQLFMKRLRKRADVRFYMCGEYGEQKLRPHYHACLFGVDFYDRVPAGRSESGSLFFASKELASFWPHGHSCVQDLTRETAAYCARYIMKKRLGRDAVSGYTRVLPTGEIVEVAPEYAAMSLKPGIGAGFLEKYRSDIFPRDYVVYEGSKFPVPRYYTKKLSKDAQMDEVQYRRYLRAREHAADNTDRRLLEREEVQLAKIRNVRRTVE